SQLLRWAFGESSPLVAPAKTVETLWIFSWCIMGGVLGLLVRNPWRFSLLVASGVAILWFGGYFAFLQSLWVPLVPPAMGWIGSAVTVTAHMSNQEKRQRAILMQIFSMHVSRKLAELIWLQRDQFLAGGRPRSQKLTATILFADLKGFSPIAEELDPNTLTIWLNTFMDKMAQVVMDNDGLVDDYAGDGIKADFGVPLTREGDDRIREDAVSAVRSALCMGKEMSRLNALWREQGLPTAGLRVGIHTGPVVAGTLGSSQRLKYTTVGNTVNIAARLESYEREHADLDPIKEPYRILISDATRKLIGEGFRTVRMGEVLFKGQKREITVYSVLDWIGEDFRDQLEESKP
ncbi:MAG: adenylate/guanylate cyclase domain-containing protein, partial [Syntrophobacteraceae bacterium]|nr:adenylate/guanylate cyclase domain-containing protein [Syntrophobacteraceae bacterium]